MVARVAEEGQVDDEAPAQPLLNDGASEMSRDMGLELEEGWDEKFVYKVKLERRVYDRSLKDLEPDAPVFHAVGIHRNW